jgi:hypothetical protein
MHYILYDIHELLVLTVSLLYLIKIIFLDCTCPSTFNR